MEKPREDKTYLSYFVLYQAKKENPLFVGQQGYFLSNFIRLSKDNVRPKILNF